MAKVLDRKKSFATIHGGGESHYFQDDTYFDAEGKELGVKAASAPKKTTKAAPVVADVDQSPTKDNVDDMAA